VRPPQAALLIRGQFGPITSWKQSSYLSALGSLATNVSLTCWHDERLDWVVREALEIPFLIREGLVRMSAPTHYRVRGFSWFLSVSQVSSVILYKTWYVTTAHFAFLQICHLLTALQLDAM
jgi:hypothetical protein